MAEHPTASVTDTAAWLERVWAALRSDGLRRTEPRLRVLETIAGYHAPFSAEQLFADLSAHSVGRTTVYRTLEQLSESGWLARIHSDGSEEGYVPSIPGHLHHLICTGCGSVVSFEGCAMDDLIAQLQRETAFRIDRHLLQLFGRCPACQTRKP